MIEQTFPEAFEQRMKNALKEKWSDFEAAHHQPAPVSIRINPKKNSNTKYPDPVPWCSSGYYLDQRPSFTLDPIFHAGGYYVQEASSMFLEQAFTQAIDRQASINVLDLCAAPGGKSTHLLSMINDNSLLVSNEVIRSRVPVLSENILKWGHVNAVVTHNDPKDFQRLQAFFDVILVDAPCSGEGLFRKDPSAMKEWSPHQVEVCSNRQRRILKDVFPALKRGGILIYSTCTYNDEENEGVLTDLNETTGVEFIPLTLDAKWGIHEVRKNNVYGYRFFPHAARGEGFFISVMRKVADEDEVRTKVKNVFSTPSKKIVEKLDSWQVSPEKNTIILRNENILQCLPKNKISAIEWIAQNLYISTAGTTLATLKHERLIPEHAAALSTELNHEIFNSVDVDLDEALQYLRKETIKDKDVAKGFALVRHNGLTLGWINVLDNRINNLYPADWRIRMSVPRTNKS